MSSGRQRLPLNQEAQLIEERTPKAAARGSQDLAAGDGRITTDEDGSPTGHLLDGLNPQQREAVLHRGSPLLIVAGAGSGKTRVLTHRIAHLLASGDAHPGQILAITFTNKAAAEMRERVAALVGPRAGRMWVSTFHSACVRILRYEASTIGIRSGFSIYDATDSRRLMTLVCRELDLDPKRHPPRAMAAKVSNLKNELIDPDTFATTAARSGTEAEGLLAQVYADYQARLAAAQAFDFDDLIMTTVNVLQVFPQVAAKYRQRFRRILVDEYQDTNHAQYVLIRELVGGPAAEPADGRADAAAEPELPMAELTVVGDADQSIYAFRGATIRNIVQFEADYPHAHTVALEQNYRSTQRILTAANAIISHNPDRVPKNLWTGSGDGAKIVGYTADSEHDEASFVVNEIADLHARHDVRHGDVAVFYRTNAQSRAIEDVLVRAGVAYRVVGGTRFYERREIKDALAYLRVLDNPDDTVSLRRILNMPKRGIGDRAEACVAALAQRDGISFAAALERAGDAPGIGARAVNAIGAFTALLAELRSLLADGVGLGQLIVAILDCSGYAAMLRDSRDPQDETRLENLEELIAVAGEFETQTPDGTLSDFLTDVSLVADADDLPDEAVAAGQAELERTEDGVVTLMTLHTAKGLEFDVVFMTGMEEGVFPHQRSLGSQKDLAEERRLAYVGVTRARQRLYLSRAVTRSVFGSQNYGPPSRFLADVPAEVIDWRRVVDAGVADTHYGRAPAAAALARRPGVRSPGNRTVITLAVGDKVTHDTFGMGTVVEVTGEGDRAMAHIDFGALGVKRLLLRYAPVEKL